MFRSGGYNLATVDGGQALELPSMTVILPSKTDGLPEMEAGLSSSLQRWLDQLDEQSRHRPSEDKLPDVHVHLPRFRIDTMPPLRNALRCVGYGPLTLRLVQATHRKGPG